MLMVRRPSAVFGTVPAPPVDAIYREVIAVAVRHRPTVEVRKVAPQIANRDMRVVLRVAVALKAFARNQTGARFNL